MRLATNEYVIDTNFVPLADCLQHGPMTYFTCLYDDIIKRSYLCCTFEDCPVFIILMDSGCCTQFDADLQLFTCQARIPFLWR
jgi:hypothetical protein